MSSLSVWNQGQLRTCCLSPFAPKPSHALSIWIDSPHWACLHFGFRHFPISACSALGLWRRTAENECVFIIIVAVTRAGRPPEPGPPGARVLPGCSAGSVSPRGGQQVRLNDDRCHCVSASLLAAAWPHRGPLGDGIYGAGLCLRDLPPLMGCPHARPKNGPALPEFAVCWGGITTRQDFRPVWVLRCLRWSCSVWVSSGLF